MSFNYRGFRTGVHRARRSIGRGELSADSPVPREVAAVRRLEGSAGRGLAWGKFSLGTSSVEGTASSGHLRNLEPEVFGVYCSPEETLWSIKKRFLAAGDHYAEHSVGHAAAAILPEDGNVFGTVFWSICSINAFSLPPSSCPLFFKLLQEKPASERGGGALRGQRLP